MIKLILTSFLFLFGCAQGAELIGAEVIQDPVETAPVGLYEEKVDDCSRSFAPDEGARKFVEYSVARWSFALGCDIHIAEDGIPVTSSPRLFKREDPTDEINGVTHVDGNDVVYLIEISLASPHPYATTTHELGHAIADLDPDVTHGHSETGIMASPIISDTIDTSSLEVVCQTFPCQVMRTQEPPALN
jgi:hypothetical protein